MYRFSFHSIITLIEFHNYTKGQHGGLVKKVILCPPESMLFVTEFAVDSIIHPLW